jgi:hypothetical protein
MSTDERLNYESLLEHHAEERAYDRRHMSDRDADLAAGRWENECERTWGS